jgi:hypothetical protein
MYYLNNTNGHPPGQPRGLWETWGRGQILGLAVLLMAGNFFFQILFYVAREDLFLPVLAGSVLGVLLPAILISRRFGFSFRREFSLSHPHPMVLIAAALKALSTLIPK